ncbi:MAG TPA: AtpZ/AtpI family protein [Geobacterales bacterium]|nr:AtpZ/AtpI family protein [Geobacterales bacterium]
MDKDLRDSLRNLGGVSTMGFAMVFSILIGILFGHWLDGKLGTAPWFFFIFMILGIIAGFKNIFILARRNSRENDHDDDAGKS